MGLQRLEQAASLGDECMAQALALGRGKTRQCEALAVAAAQRDVVDSNGQWELALKMRLETLEAEMRTHMVEAELELREALRAEARQEEEAFLERLERRCAQEALAECHRAEEEATRHEMHVDACCQEERSRLAARDAACAEAWLVYAWA